LRIVVDPMYGAVSGYLATLLAQAGCDVVELHGDVRDDFGGLHPEPAEPWVDDCEQEVLAQKADVALVFDGDGDRASLIDERGHLVAAHNLAPLVLCQLVENKHMTGRVVTSLASSRRVFRQAKRLGLETYPVPVGFDRIYGELIQGDVLVGCEEFGGVAIPSHLRERDGLLVCLLVLELLATRGGTLSELVGAMLDAVGRSEYGRRNVRLDPASAQTLENLLPGMNPLSVAGKEPVSVSHSDGLRVQFADDSWAMLRISRVAGVVRTYAEASTSKERDALLRAMAELARQPRLWRRYGDGTS
jgi:phosphomannomutase